MIFKLHYLHISRYSVPLHCVFHSIRFKVNKGWSKALLLFLCPYTPFFPYLDKFMSHILFCLESMMNLARNGRTSMAVAKIAGMLGIRVCGDVKAGMITPVHKPRGAKKATELRRLESKHLRN